MSTKHFRGTDFVTLTEALEIKILTLHGCLQYRKTCIIDDQVGGIFDGTLLWSCMFSSSWSGKY